MPAIYGHAPMERLNGRNVVIILLSNGNTVDLSEIRNVKLK